MGGRVLITATVLAVVAAGTGSSPALAAPTATADAATASGPQVRVTLQLAQPHAAELHALGTLTGLSHSARVDQVRRLLPSAAALSQVASVVRRDGLTVLAQTPLSVVVSGTASRVHALFGDSGESTRGARAAGMHVPADLAGLVAQAVSGGPVLRPLFTPTPTDGPQAAAVYHAPIAPPVGGSVQTVATIELSGWNSAALTRYSVEHPQPLRDPVASGQYTEVSVDGADPTQPDGKGGDIEVALDQEAILGAAPYANQRVYFAPNGNGFLDAFDAVAADATDPGTNHHITALSVSWGACEDLFSSAGLNAFDSVMATLQAAGVTVFTASADRGAFDCSTPGTTNADNSFLSVDFPSSSPNAVGVGGTSLDHTTNPSVPVEQVWWQSANPSSSDDFQGFGSGGGLSHVWAPPSYQASLGFDHRAVPDISLDGDPASGLVIDVYDNGILDHTQYGGTSLAAPLAAATLTDLLASRGLSNGLGDIHDALYNAPPDALRDVTVGHNGGYFAGPGFDQATGLGAPLWAELATTVLPLVTLTVPSVVATRTIPLTVATPPQSHFIGWAAGTGPLPTHCSQASSTHVPTRATATVDGSQLVWVLAATATNCYLSGASVFVDTVAPVAHVDAPPGSPGTFTWGSTDGAPSSGHGPYTVTVTHGAVVDYSASTALTSFATPEVPGTTYVATVVAHDVAGNASDPATASFVMPESSYTPVRACRIFDTRHGAGACSSAQPLTIGPVAGGQVLAVQVAGVGGVPSGATAVVLNVTAVDATRATYVSVYPDGGIRPAVSNLNVHSAAPVPNLVVVPLRNGKLDFFNAAGTVDLIADLSGYYAPVAGSLYLPVGPCRVFDTRHGAGSCGSAPHVAVAPVGPGHVLSVPITGVAGVPAGATAVVLNVTAVGATRATYVSVYPHGGGRPAVSNLNVSTAAAIPNLVIVPVTDGMVDFFNAAGSVDLVADLAGFYQPAAGSLYAPVGPCRVVDTRSGHGACSGAPTVSAVGIGAGQVLTVPITSVSGVPADATAVVLNVTAVGATRPTYISVYPHGGSRPAVSNLNVGSALPVPNLVIVRVTDGMIDFFNAAGSVNLIADLAGYYEPSS